MTDNADIECSWKAHPSLKSLAELRCIPLLEQLDKEGKLSDFEHHQLHHLKFMRRYFWLSILAMVIALIALVISTTTLFGF